MTVVSSFWQRVNLDQWQFLVVVIWSWKLRRLPGSSPITSKPLFRLCSITWERCPRLHAFDLQFGSRIDIIDFRYQLRCVSFFGAIRGNMVQYLSCTYWTSGYARHLLGYDFKSSEHSSLQIAVFTTVDVEVMWKIRCDPRQLPLRCCVACWSMVCVSSIRPSDSLCNNKLSH